jgi:hypothetical protein
MIVAWRCTCARSESWGVALGAVLAVYELHPVVGAVRGLVREGVEGSDGVGGCHAVSDLIGGEPADALGFLVGGEVAAGRVAAEDEGDDAAREVLVGTSESFDGDGHAGFLGDLSADAFLEGFVQF